MVKPILLIAAAGSLLVGCQTNETSTGSTAPATLPAISSPPSQGHNSGQVIWHDLATRDIEAAKEFYGELFGWTFEQLREDGRRYTAIYNKDVIIGGMFQFTSKDRKGATGEWLVNLSSCDVERDAGKFADAGGEIIEPARDVPDRGTAAFVRDPQQAVMVLTRSSSGDPVEGEVPVGSWLWNELWTHDAEAAVALYSDIFHYTSEPVEGPDGRPYFLLKKNDLPVGGILGIRNKEIRPHWVPYVRVADLQVSLLLAMELGANVLIEPDETIRDGKVSLIQGPTGEPVILQEYEFETR